MEPHSCDGTQRLAEPVSRTTLNDWGGVPMEISEKSENLVSDGVHGKEICSYITLSIQEVRNRHRMIILVEMDRGVSEHLFLVRLGANTHEPLAGVFLIQRLRMRSDVCMFQLLRQRHFLELQLVDAAAVCGPDQGRARSKDQTGLHIQISDTVYTSNKYRKLLMMFVMS